MNGLPSNFHEIEILMSLCVVFGFLGFNALLEIPGLSRDEKYMILRVVCGCSREICPKNID